MASPYCPRAQGSAQLVLPHCIAPVAAWEVALHWARNQTVAGSPLAARADSVEGNKATGAETVVGAAIGTAVAAVAAAAAAAVVVAAAKFEAAVAALEDPAVAAAAAAAAAAAVVADIESVAVED